MNAIAHDFSNGVCGHSMPTRWDDWVIFCVGNDPYRDAAFTTWANGLGHRFKSLIGSYKGKTERSYIMRLADFEKSGAVQWTKAEESILVLRPRRKADGSLLLRHDAPIDAILVYQDGREESIGVWANVPEYHAKKCDGWTYDPMFGEWYTVV